MIDVYQHPTHQGWSWNHLNDGLRRQRKPSVLLPATIQSQPLNSVLAGARDHQTPRTRRLSGAKDVNLPNIIAGKNASGKTSLLRGLVEIDRLLVETPSPRRNHAGEIRCREKMGITTLEIQYSVHLGNNRCPTHSRTLMEIDYHVGNLRRVAQPFACDNTNRRYFDDQLSGSSHVSKRIFDLPMNRPSTRTAYSNQNGSKR